jgi:hypothetical protein
VVVAAGDLIGASPLVSALFHDEGTIEALNRVDLEFSSVGNHEFDEGSSELLRMQEGGCHPTDPNSCQGAKLATPSFPAAAAPVPFEGAKFKYLAANVTVDATGKTLFPAYGVKSFKGHRIAFIGMTLKDTPTIVTPAGVAGLTFKDEAETVNGLIPELRRHGVRVIVVLVHQGASAAVSDINGCTSDAGKSRPGHRRAAGRSRGVVDLSAISPGQQPHAAQPVGASHPSDASQRVRPCADRCRLDARYANRARDRRFREQQSGGPQQPDHRRQFSDRRNCRRL